MYADMRTQAWPRSPGINVATHKSQSCCLSWCSGFAECGSKSTLMSGGAGGCAQGPVHRWLRACLCIACGSHSSTPHACCRTVRASLHLLKRSFGLRWDQYPGTGATQYGQQVCYCRRKLTAAHISVILLVHYYRWMAVANLKT